MKPSKPIHSEYEELIRNAAVGLPHLDFKPLKTVLVRPDIQKRLDEYRKLPSKFP